MSACFADTYYFLAFLNPRDTDHHRVRTFNATFRRPLVTTQWILTEVADALAKPRNRRVFSEFLLRLRSDARATIIGADEELFEAGLRLYRDRPDKDWPLTDCISFVVMEEHGVTEALTNDRHFEQAGFAALLK